MLNVYCISGMGVDGRLFKNLKLKNCRIHHVNWNTPLKNESLPDYAMRLAEQIDTSQPFALIGVSFGGMCCVEIAKRLKPVKTFVISSCKVSKELPLKITFWKNLAFYKFLKDSRYIFGAMLVKKQFGVNGKEQAQKFLEMLRSAPKNYFRGAVQCIMTWKNDVVPESVVQIHGTDDQVLPHKRIKCDYKIKGGNHFMIVNKADEINEIINKELEGLTE
jgi:pimeloyl-ACP methyl ester carboxylesterase